MALYQWLLDVPRSSLPMLNDFVRMAVIQLVVQFLFFVVNPAQNPFFSTIFLQTIGFVLVGVLVYWLIVRNLFVFRSTTGSRIVEGFVDTGDDVHGEEDSDDDEEEDVDSEDGDNMHHHGGKHHNKPHNHHHQHGKHEQHGKLAKDKHDHTNDHAK